MLIQLLNGLASASSLFLVAAGLSLIFGVSRILNFAHGSLYALGLYIAYGLIQLWGGGALAFWSAIPLAAAAVALVGVAIELTVLRRIYRAPQLFQLLATFAVVLVLQDVMLYVWGPEDLLGPRAPGLEGAIPILGARFPQYDLFLIGVGPLVLVGVSLLLKRSRWGLLIRAATHDRAMASALGVNQARLFTGVFALGSLLAGLGGALQIPREPATLAMDLQALGDAFVVVVIGGLGSLPGAYVAALIIAEVKAVCIGLGTVSFGGWSISFSKLTLVVEFVVMALVLAVRPTGLLGRSTLAPRPSSVGVPLRPDSRPVGYAAGICVLLLVLLPLGGRHAAYPLVLVSDMLIAVLFAASLHFVMGPAGLHSFGHAAYFGVGAYAAAILFRSLSVPMELALLAGPLVAGVAALVFGWFSVRLTGVYFAMFTLAAAQIVWSVAFQWDAVTGGSNGLTGVWPSPWLSRNHAYYVLTVAVCASGVLLLRRILFSPFGYAMRAVRDSPLRSEALGIDVHRVLWVAFAIAGVVCGYAGGLFAFSKGNVSPETVHIGRSIDGLVMVLLGGVETLSGPIVGAAVFTWLRDVIVRNTDAWRAVLGVTVLLLVLVFPSGIVGFWQNRFAREEVDP